MGFALRFLRLEHPPDPPITGTGLPHPSSLRLKPHCMHRISVCVRCVVENVPEPDWQRLKFGNPKGILTKKWRKCDTVDRRNPAKPPLLCEILPDMEMFSISTGAGFLPSTVKLMDFPKYTSDYTYDS